MSYAAEPFGRFVDDLLTALAGGEVRQRFPFVRTELEYRLSAPGPVVPGTVEVFGLADGAYRDFRRDVDWVLEGDRVRWLARDDGTPAADAVWPEEGSGFYVNFRHLAPGTPTPILTDHNPGSVTRLLAESFAREYTVLSRQLEGVYRGAFLDTAGGRDLDAVAELVGIRRRGAASATGSVVFARPTPAPADVFVPAGTRLSTSEAPAVVFETTEDRTMRRGDLSAEAPVAALEEGPAGVVDAGLITVVHRPILGVSSVANPRPTRLSGSREDDDALRARARRALEAAGRATPAALLHALTTVQGVGEKDVRVQEDHLAHPGVLRLSVAVPDLDDDRARELVRLVEDTRPAGVRVLHDLGAFPDPGAPSPGDGEPAEEGGPVTGGDGEAGPLLPVTVEVVVTPAAAALDTEERRDLEARTRAAVDAVFAEVGVGGTVVYNRIVADLMALEGVLDVALSLFPESDADAPRRRNLLPASPDRKPVPGTVTVEIGGRPILVDVTVAITLQGAGLVGDPDVNRLEALRQVEADLRLGAPGLTGTLDGDALLALLGGSEAFTVTSIHWVAHYQESGVRILKRDPVLPVGTLEQVFIGRVTLEQEVAA